MIILGYNSYGELTVASRTGRRYRYLKVSPEHYDYVRWLVSKKMFGKAWQYLKRNFDVSY